MLPKASQLTGSANALSQRIVARALHSWLPCTVTTAGNDKVYKITKKRNNKKSI